MPHFEFTREYIMTLWAYGKKEFENNEYVVYSCGFKTEDMPVKFRFNKGTLELIIIKAEKKFSDWAIFKIAREVKRSFIETGEFPDKPVSVS